MVKDGFEPPTSRLSSERSNQLSYLTELCKQGSENLRLVAVGDDFTTGMFTKWTISDLNRRPPTCKAGVLPTELIAQNNTTPTGFEPVIFYVTGRRNNRYTMEPIYKNY